MSFPICDISKYSIESTNASQAMCNGLPFKPYHYMLHQFEAQNFAFISSLFALHVIQVSWWVFFVALNKQSTISMAII